MLKTPDVKIIMPTEQVKWIRSNTNGAIVMSESASPDGKAGRGAYAFVLITSAFILLMLGSLVWHGLDIFT